MPLLYRAILIELLCNEDSLLLCKVILQIIANLTLIKDLLFEGLVLVKVGNLGGEGLYLSLGSEDGIV